MGDPEFLLWLKKEPLHQQFRVDGVVPYTSHLAKVVQQENQRRRTFKKMTFQSIMPDMKSREMEQMVNWTRITTVAQFCDRDEKEGQTMTKWPKKSLDQHVKKIEEIPELL